jgi:hypothetical protein
VCTLSVTRRCIVDRSNLLCVVAYNHRSICFKNKKIIKKGNSDFPPRPTTDCLCGRARVCLARRWEVTRPQTATAVKRQAEAQFSFSKKNGDKLLWPAVRFASSSRCRAFPASYISIATRFSSVLLPRQRVTLCPHSVPSTRF